MTEARAWCTQPGWGARQNAPARTIGQIMFYSDHGEFFDGDIHDSNRDAANGLQDASQPLINEQRGKTTIPSRSTCVRQPLTRGFSALL